MKRGDGVRGKKSSFIMKTDYREQIEMLPMKERGILLTAVINYVDGIELPEMDGMVKMAFSFVRADIDRENEKYWKTVEARREAGKLGGRPQKANGFTEKQEEAKKANGFFEKQNNPDKELDKEKDKEIKKDIMCEALALFERLWKMYPNKKGKGQVSDTQKKRLLAIGEPTLVKAIKRYSLELQKDADWRKPQNGSTFFNSGYVDYLDGNYEPGKAPEKKNNNRFSNFHQREYDYDALEEQLLEAQTKEDKNDGI